MISESKIDEKIESLSKEDALVFLEKSYEGAVMSYLAEEAEWMASEERDLLFYTASVVISFFPNTGVEDSDKSLSTLIELEEKNFQQLYTSKSHAFYDRVTKFFDDFQEEDLLAFIEDACHLEDNEGLTPAGQELIFIKLKSLLDFLLLSNL
jgi:hypothetical protein